MALQSHKGLIQFIFHDSGVTKMEPALGKIY